MLDYWPWSLTMLKWSCFAFRVGRCCLSRVVPAQLMYPREQLLFLVPLPSLFTPFFSSFILFYPVSLSLNAQFVPKEQGLQMCLRRRISSAFCPICYIDKGLLAPIYFPFTNFFSLLLSFIVRRIYRENNNWFFCR